MKHYFRTAPHLRHGLQPQPPAQACQPRESAGTYSSSESGFPQPLPRRLAPPVPAFHILEKDAAQCDGNRRQPAELPRFPKPKLSPLVLHGRESCGFPESLQFAACVQGLRAQKRSKGKAGAKEPWSDLSSGAWIRKVAGRPQILWKQAFPPPISHAGGGCRQPTMTSDRWE